MSDGTPFDLNLRVSQYVRLRDLIAEDDAAHKEKMQVKRQMLEQLGNLILGHLSATNQESARTAAGTAYVTTKKSASIADGDAFMAFVIENRAWDMLDRRANSTAVQDFVAEHGNAPPGVNYSEVRSIGVRRA